VVSSDKFVRVMILPLRGKDRLSGKGGKWLKETTRLVVGEFPYRLLNGDTAVPWWAVNFGKQILVSPLWFASLVCFLAYLLFFRSIYLGVLVLSAGIITLLVIIYRSHSRN
jgi:hypothetical protein